MAPNKGKPNVLPLKYKIGGEYIMDDMTNDNTTQGGDDAGQTPTGSDDQGQAPMGGDDKGQTPMGGGEPAAGGEEPAGETPSESPVGEEPGAGAPTEEPAGGTEEPQAA